MFKHVNTTAMTSLLSKALGGSGKIPKPDLGYVDGLKIIAYGPKGGKIVGYGKGGKPIYAGSPEAKKLAAHKTMAMTPKHEDHDGIVLSWLQHLGFNPGTAPGVVSLTKDEYEYLASHLAIAKATPLGGGKFGVHVKDLLAHVGAALTPPTPEHTTITAALAAGAHGPDAPFPESLLPKLKVTTSAGGSHGHTWKVEDNKGNFKWIWKTKDPHTENAYVIARAEEACARLAKLVFPEPKLFSHAQFLEWVGKGSATGHGVLLTKIEGSEIGPETGHKIENAALQKHAYRLIQHQVFDWLISNHDSHGGNFLVTPDGDIAAVDKGQAFKFIGNNDESLSPSYNPNSKTYGVASTQLWNNFTKGEIKLDEKKVLAAVVEVLSGIDKLSVEQYHQILLPYLEEAAAHVPHFNPAAKWEAMKKRFLSMREDWSSFLSGMFGHAVDLKPKNDEPAPVTVVEAAPAILESKPGADNFETMPATEPKITKVPGWPVKKGNVEVHHPGEPPKGTWPSKYPGPGYTAVVTYKGKDFKFVFEPDEKTGKPSSQVWKTGDHDEWVLVGKGFSINDAADVPQLLDKGLSPFLSATEKKGKFGYGANKLFQFAKFEEELKGGASIPETPPEQKLADESVQQLEAEKLVAPKKKALSIHEIVSALPDGVVTDAAALPPQVQNFLAAITPTPKGPWPLGWPMLGLVHKLQSGGVVRLQAIGTNALGAPLVQTVKLFPDGGVEAYVSDFLFDVDAEFKESPDVLKMAASWVTETQGAKPAPASGIAVADPDAPFPVTIQEGKGPLHESGIAYGTEVKLKHPVLGDVLLDVMSASLGPGKPFVVSFMDGTGKSGEFASLSAAAAHVFSEALKAEGHSLDVGDGKGINGWKFWGLKQTTVASAPVPEVKSTPAAHSTPTSTPEQKAILDAMPVGSAVTTKDGVGVKGLDGNWHFVDFFAGAAGVGSFKFAPTPDEKKLPVAVKPAWLGDKAVTTDDLNALPHGSNVESSDYSSSWTKDADGHWVSDQGTLHTAVAIALALPGKGAHIVKQPGAYGWGGWKVATQQSLDALPLGSQITTMWGSVLTKALTLTPNKKDATISWFGPDGSVVNAPLGVQATWHPPVGPLPEYVDLKPAEPPPPEKPAPILATATAAAPVPAVKIVDHLPSYVNPASTTAKVFHAVWKNAEKLHNTTGGPNGTKFLSFKSPKWAEWVPPPGLIIEGTFQGKKTWFTTVVAGYTVSDDGAGEAAVPVQFAAWNEDGKIGYGESAVNANFALASALKYGLDASPEDLNGVAAAFNLDGAMFPADTHYESTFAPAAATAISKPLPEIPPEVKQQVVAQKLALGDVIALASTKAKYGPMSVSPPSQGKFPGCVYLNLKDAKDKKTPKSVWKAKLEQFIADHDLSAHVVMKPQESNWGGSWAAIKESALQHEVVVQATIEEALSSAPVAPPAPKWPADGVDLKGNFDYLDTAPDGTHAVINYDDGTKSDYVKSGYKWIIAQVDPTTKIASIVQGAVGWSAASTFSKDMSVGSVGFALYAPDGKVLAEIVHDAPAPLPVVPLTKPWEGSKTVSKEMFVALPVGTEIAWGKTVKYTKTAAGWKSIYEEIYADQAFLSFDKTITSVEIVKYPALPESKATEIVGKHWTVLELKALPTGAKVILPNDDVVTKVGVDTWTGGKYVEWDSEDLAAEGQLALIPSSVAIPESPKEVSTAQHLDALPVGSKIVDTEAHNKNLASKLAFTFVKKADGKWENAKSGKIVSAIDITYAPPDTYTVIEEGTSAVPESPKAPAFAPKKLFKSWSTDKIETALKGAPVGASLTFADGSAYEAVEKLSIVSGVWWKSLDTGYEVSSFAVAQKVKWKGGATLAAPGAVKPQPPKAATPAAPKKTAEQIEAEKKAKADLDAKIAKAIEYASWSKGQPQPQPGTSLYKALQLQQQEMGGLAFHAHVGGDGLMVSLPESEGGVSALLSKTGWPGLKKTVDTPLGKMGVIDGDALVAKHKVALSEIDGPDGKKYPHGTTFTEKQVSLGTVGQQIAKEPGFHKTDSVLGGDATKRALKFKFPGYDFNDDAKKQEAIGKAAAILAKHGIEPQSVIAGSSNIIAIVPKDHLDKDVGFETVHEPALPQQPPPLKQAGIPFAVGPQKIGGKAIVNEADLGGIAAIKPGGWGHFVRVGGPGVFRNMQVMVKKVTDPKTGKKHVEVIGDIYFDPKKTKLTKNTVSIAHWDAAGASPTLLPHDGDSGEHQKGEVDDNSDDGYTGEVDGATIKVFYGKKTALLGTTVIEVPEGQDVREAVNKLLALAGIPENVVSGNHDEHAERIFIKQQLVRQGLGPKGWGYRAGSYDDGDHVLKDYDDKQVPISSYNDEKWLDAQLKKLQMTHLVDTAEIKVSNGGVHTVWINDPKKDLSKKARFVQTGLRMSPHEGLTLEKAVLMVTTSHLKVGAPSKKQAALYGSHVYNGQASSDMSTGGATGLMTRVVPMSWDSSSAFAGVAGPGGAYCRLIYHPRVVNRADWRLHYGDDYGNHKKGHRDGNNRDKLYDEEFKHGGESNEACFEHGIGVEDIAGVWCNDESVREAMIAGAKKQGMTQVNGIPVEDYFFVSAEKPSAIEKACAGLKGGAK